MFTLNRKQSEVVSGAQCDSRALSDACFGLCTAFGLYTGAKLGVSSMHDVGSIGGLADNLSILGKNVFGGLIVGGVVGVVLSAYYDESMRKYSNSNHHFIKVHR